MLLNRLFFALCAAALLIACGADNGGEERPAPPDPEARRLNSRGAFLLKNSQPRKAVAVLEQAVERAPEMAMIHFNLGLARYRLGENILAIASFQQAVEIDSLNGAWRFILGDALSAEHRYAEGAVHLRMAVELEPQKVLYQYQLGRTLRAMSDFEAAIAAFDRALVLQPDFVDALYHRSELLSRSNQFAAAEAGFLALLAQAPDHVAALVDLAILQSKENRTQEAVVTLERAIALEPRHTQAHYLLHQALNGSGEVQAAAKALKTYQRLTTSKRHYDQGQVHLLHGEKQQAVSSFTQSIEADSTFADAYLSLCTIYIQTQNTSAALPLLERVLRLEPDHGEAYSLMGEVLLVERDFVAAEKKFEKAVAIDSASVRAMFGLGRARFLNKKYALAAKALRRTIEWAPAHLPAYAEAHYALALVQVQQKNMAEAKALLKKVLQLNPEYKQAAAKLAQLQGTGQ